MEYTGKVIRRLFAKGTKSERIAVMLVTENHEYVLRRQGGNPVSDPELDKLVDKTICFEGTVYGYTLIVTSWSGSN